MDEFELGKKEILRPIYFEAGAALFDCQTFENGLAYILYLFSRLGLKELDTERAISILENEEKKTAGQLIAMLTKFLTISAGIEKSLTAGLEARNKLVHRYFIDNIERMADPSEHEKIVREIRALRSEVRSSHRQLEPFVKGLALKLDGIDIDKVTAEIKTKVVRTYRGQDFDSGGVIKS